MEVELNGENPCNKSSSPHNELALKRVSPMRVLSVNTMIHQKSTQFLNFHAIRVPLMTQPNSQVCVLQNVQGVSDFMRIWR